MVIMIGVGVRGTGTQDEEIERWMVREVFKAKIRGIPSS